LLEEHEGSHTGGIKCAEPSCSFSRIGFKNSAGLKRHTNEFHATPETIIKPAVVRRQFVCGGNISEGTTPNIWGCAQHYARQDELNAHFRSPLGRRCINQFVEAHISRPDHSMMIDGIPPGVEQALSRDQVSALQLKISQAPNMIPSRSQHPSNFTPEQMTRPNLQQPSQIRAQLHKAQDLTSRAQQPPNSQQTSGAQAQNSATMDRNVFIAQKDARFKALGAEVERAFPRNPPVPHPPVVRAQMQQWLRDSYPQLKQLNKCLLFYNLLADNPEPLLKQMFEMVSLI
jgi:hypothetical protein